ncbi:MAG TPA: AI-2E family transporter [Polyangiales bacterium]|nr:AI-2E family transporter [Polyangiales bacterium]
MSADSQQRAIEISASTIIKLLFAAVLVWAGLKLWPQIVLFFVSLVLAIALEPIVDWLDRHRLSRGMSVLICALLLLLGIALAIIWVLPPAIEQLQEFVRKLPQLEQQIRHEVTPRDPTLRKWTEGMWNMPSSGAAALKLGNVLVVGQATLEGVMTFGVMMVVTLYLVLDGKRLYAWLLAYVPRAHRSKMAETVHEVTHVVRAYVRGQIVTSLLFSGFTLVLLTALGLPAAVPLSLFAGVCDVIPMIGIVLAIAPAALLALATSKLAALIVVGAYLLYHMFENYFIAPRVYGSHLRMSTLTVLLALIVGGSLFGLVGAVLILPVVAAYPTIERIWLADYLGKHVIADHGALARAVESGDEGAVDKVLRAERHADERGPSRPGDPHAVGR